MINNHTFVPDAGNVGEYNQIYNRLERESTKQDRTRGWTGHSWMHHKANTNQLLGLTQHRWPQPEEEDKRVQRQIQELGGLAEVQQGKHSHRI